MIRKLKNLGHLFWAILANIYWRFPSRKLTVVGVTGTDGKTTTVHLIHHILKTAGEKVDLVSTVSAPGLHTTTPNPWILQKLLRQMVGRGVKYVVLEATSHGLDQHRLWGVKFDIGVVTNITHEHLDYHKTYKNYLEAKAKLFRGVKFAILNRDDKSFFHLNSKFEIRNSKLITYGIKNEADFTPKKFPFKTLLPGEYNQYNCLAAIAATSVLGIAPEKIRKAVAGFKGVIGRMEEINEGQDFKVIVDFAHTPNALENALKTLRGEISKKKRERLIAVFGCAGLRDVAKRPMMGEIAAKLADITVLTAEDPRTEDVNEIIQQIAQGCLKGGAKEKDLSSRSNWSNLKGKFFVRIPDRREAIRFAIQKLAKRGDVVVICGKGHERSMCYGKTEYPWSDQDEARKALREFLKKKNV
jgi:UDP-N-acetylmuramoyl-L-alanyl-D-glutamate--2,6-diaminopimelate ligase